MRFILDLWPDLEDPTPEDLLAYALSSIKDNPELRWVLAKDDGTVIADDVARRPIPAQRFGLPSITHSDESIEGWLSTVEHLAEIGAVVELVDADGNSLGDHIIKGTARGTDGIPVVMARRFDAKKDRYVPGTLLQSFDLDDISDIRIY